MDFDSGSEVTREDIFALRSDPSVRVILKWLLQREQMLSSSIDCVKDVDLADSHGYIIRLREIRLLIQYLTKSAEARDQEDS